ncbi:UNVERIFIED_CONTAM: hypothetical protein GTU68_009652 [Idotea baltica]|nr:hypothetical protein [Idotea baltica]
MRLTAYTDYSLRVLIFLAIRREDKSTISEIAQSYEISKNHLMKVVQGLSQKGYITATRGKNGGLYLKKDPDDINIGLLVKDLENDLVLVECFGPDNTCKITPECGLRDIFREALEAFFSTLEGYTLSDLLTGDRPRKLAALLHID